MRTARIVLLTGAVAAATAVPALADKPGDKDTTKTSKDVVTISCSGGTVSLDGPQKLWPPNHKMVDEVVTATSSASDSDGVPETSLTLMDAQVVESATGGDGGPNGPDSSGAGTTGPKTDKASAVYQVRAERSGKGDGRTYVIDWSATFEDGSSCSSTGDTMTDDEKAPFTIAVPHDQGKGNGA